jgi:hypothetical protein
MSDARTRRMEWIASAWASPPTVRLMFLHCFASPRRCAVEFGLMSTTTQKETAFFYSGVKKQRGTVLEIAAGRVDVGASISFLSQYPGEEEFLMQPLACLEARSRPHPSTKQPPPPPFAPLQRPPREVKP